MLPILLALSLSSPAAPSGVTCDEVRRVRAALVTRGLDDASLRVLEGQACAVPDPPRPYPSPPSDDAQEVNPHATSRTCLDLRTMSLLGHAAGDAQTNIDEVDELMNVACSLGLSERRLSWKNGISARTLSDGWNWPNGITAKTMSGGWNWPNGITAKTMSGAWSWPNGITAVSTMGRWSDASGVTVAREQLLGPVCRAEPRRCKRLGELQALDADLATASILSWVWLTR